MFWVGWGVAHMPRLALPLAPSLHGLQGHCPCCDACTPSAYQDTACEETMGTGGLLHHPWELQGHISNCKSHKVLKRTAAAAHCVCR